MTIDTQQVALAHDAMAEEYDNFSDLWYPWLYAQIHEFIAKNLPINFTGRPQALDAGCGTGLQSILLSWAGCDVLGFDIATRLLEVARAKSFSHIFPPLEAPPLFESTSWDDAENHHARLASYLESIRHGREVRPPIFYNGDITLFDFGEGKYDIIVCCGSVLSFIDSYAQVLKKMASGLKKHGLLLLELEQKRNLDLIWPLIDYFLGGALHYEQNFPGIFKNLCSPRGKSVRVDYPFELSNGNYVILPIWLFSINELRHLFSKYQLEIKDRLGIHWATNLYPSTILHNLNPGRFLKGSMKLLMPLDALLGRFWPMWRLGCSVIYCLRKS